jgi:hypothetical protein
MNRIGVMKTPQQRVRVANCIGTGKIDLLSRHSLLSPARRPAWHRVHHDANAH